MVSQIYPYLYDIYRTQTVTTECDQRHKKTAERQGTAQKGLGRDLLEIEICDLLFEQKQQH